jgi:hypothetical protein
MQLRTLLRNQPLPLTLFPTRPLRLTLRLRLIRMPQRRLPSNTKAARYLQPLHKKGSGNRMQ